LQVTYGDFASAADCKALQQGADSGGLGKTPKTPVFPEKYEGSPLGAMIKMGGTGLELPRETTGNSRSLSVSGAESGALAGREALVDPGLAVVIEAWLTLPAAIKAGILAMVRVGPQ
jgi:hypothetical protein